MMQERDHKRLRFRYDDDVIVLREIVSRNPFVNGNAAWEEVKNGVLVLTQKQYSIKTISQHIQLLLNQWEAKEKKNEKSSGVEEPYSERDLLLQELYDLVEESKRTKDRKKIVIGKKKVQTEIVKNTKDCAALNFMYEHNYNQSTDINAATSEEPGDFIQIEEILTDVNSVEREPTEVNEVVLLTTDQGAGQSNAIVTPSSNKFNTSKRITGPIRSRAKKTNYLRRSGLDYLKEKQEKEMELEERRLKLEERRLEVEERKVAVSENNVALAEKKFLFESEQFKNIIDSQQALITNLFDIIKNKMDN